MEIGGRTFKSPIYFSTLKDSEHAAAKEAFQSLSVGEVQEASILATLLGFFYICFLTVLQINFLFHLSNTILNSTW